VLRVTRLAGFLVLCAGACAPVDSAPQGVPANLAAPPTLPSAAVPKWSFENVVASSGIDFRHTFGDDQFSKILEDTGSGAALIDFDGDGLLDVYVANDSEENLLWKQERHDGKITFREQVITSAKAEEKINGIQFKPFYSIFPVSRSENNFGRVLKGTQKICAEQVWHLYIEKQEINTIVFKKRNSLHCIRAGSAEFQCFHTCNMFFQNFPRRKFVIYY
jgi:hypothetical protein